MLVVSSLLPTRSNINGPSALLYSVLKYRSNGEKVRLYCFNHIGATAQQLREIEAELNIEIEVELRKPRRILRYFRGILKILRGLPHESGIFNLTSTANLEIASTKTVLLYPSWLVGLMKNANSDIHILAPDCMALHYRRTLRHHPKRLNRYIAAFRWLLSINLERVASKRAAAVYFVGRDDLRYYYICGGRNGIFIRHPISEDML